MAEEQWHFMDEDERERFLMTWLPMHAGLHDLLADFRFGGYRILSDLICDIDDENAARERKQLIRDGDSPAFISLMEAYRNKSGAQTYREADTALADGLEQGPLRMTDVTVPEELEKRIKAVLPKGLPPEMACTLIAYYAANKPEDTDWVVLPVASFDAYFGTTSFGRKYLRLIPGEILERPDSGFGVCRYRVQEEYRI